MLLNIKVPDETYETYARRNPGNPRLELEASLQVFAELDPKRSGLVLTAEELSQLNRILGHPISSTKELLEHVERSQRVSLGEGAAITLSLGQRTRLKAQAEFFKEDFKKFAERQVGAGVIAIVGP